jgi:hypothetical protein
MSEGRQANKLLVRMQQKSSNKASVSGNVTCPTSSSPNRRRILPLAAGRSFKSPQVDTGPSFGAKARIAKAMWKSDTKTTPRASPGRSLLNPRPSSSPNQPLRRTPPLPMSAKKTMAAPVQLLSKSPTKSPASSSAKKPSPVRNLNAKSPQVTKSSMPFKTKPSARNPDAKSPQKKQKVVENGTASNPVDIEDSPLFNVDNSDDEIEIVDASEAAVNMVQVVQKNATGDDDEVMVVGHVNHVELPHLRQHCTGFLFDDTPDVYDVYAQSVVTVNVQSCPLCYCYVCDCPAKDCSKWHSEKSGNFAVNHCCATEKSDLWVQRRKKNHKTAVAAAAKKKRKSPCRPSSRPDNIITIDDDSDPEDIFTI